MDGPCSRSHHRKVPETASPCGRPSGVLWGRCSFPRAGRRAWTPAPRAAGEEGTYGTVCRACSASWGLTLGAAPWALWAALPRAPGPTWPATLPRAPKAGRGQRREEQDQDVPGPHHKAVQQAGARALMALVIPATAPPVKKAMRPIRPGTQPPPPSEPGPTSTRPSPMARSCSKRKVVSAVIRPAQIGPQRMLSRRAEARSSPPLLPPLSLPYRRVPVAELPPVDPRETRTSSSCDRPPVGPDAGCRDPGLPPPWTSPRRSPSFPIGAPPRRQDRCRKIGPCRAPPACPRPCPCLYPSSLLFGSPGGTDAPI
jgi:hypothetical protein